MCAKTAVETQTHEVNQKSRRAFKHFDVKFAPEIVGNGSNGIVGPFEAIHVRFYQKQIIVFYAGAFAEINEDGEKLIKRLAKIAGSCGLNTDRKGGASRIMAASAISASNCLS